MQDFTLSRRGMGAKLEPQREHLCKKKLSCAS
jgi:hypothetical protein